MRWHSLNENKLLSLVEFSTFKVRKGLGLSLKVVSVRKDGWLKYILQFFGIKADSLKHNGYRRRPDTIYLHYNEHYFPNNLALRYINFPPKLKAS